MARRHVLIGIGGDSGSGRATFADGIAGLLGHGGVLILSADGYLRYGRRERKTLGITPLDPACHHLDILARDLASLARGDAVLVPRYDHVSGEHRASEYTVPARVILVEGLLLFHTPALRDLFDLKVFLDPAEALRREWKLRRDSTIRGRDRNDVLADIEEREADANAYLRPQRDWADVVVRFFASNAAESDARQLDAQLMVRPGPTTVRRAFDALAERRGPQTNSIHTADVRARDGSRVDVIDIASSIDAADAAAITASLTAAMIVVAGSDRGISPESVPAHPLAVAQAVVAYQAFADRSADARLRRALARYGVTLARKTTS